MKRTLLAVALLLGVLVGCTQNKISISNEADSDVYFLFRGSTYQLAHGASREISDIPNGSFEYSTTYAYPDGVTKVTAEEDLAGVLEFSRDKTEYVLMYASVWLPEDSSYSVNLNIVRSDRLNSASTEP